VDLGVLLALVAGLLVGLAVGAAAVWLRAAALASAAEQHRLAAQLAGERASAAESQLAAARAELRVQLEAATTRERLIAKRDDELREAFSALSADALARNTEAFVRLAEEKIKALTQKADGDARQHQQAIAALVDPVQQALQRLDGQLRSTEKEREGAYAALRTQVSQMQTTSLQLQSETRHLVNALRAPQARGRWGEVQLERIVELAGMVEHCDFERQVTATGRIGDADAVIRPDLVVHLAGGKRVVVDAKVSLAAYLEAMDADDEATQQRRLAAHARHLRAHIESLAAKSYWAAFDVTPEFVVLFVPGDSFLQAALAAEPSILEHGFERNVVIATPTTLIALLRTVAHTWRQEALAANAAQVLSIGKELHERLATMGEHLAKLGRQLGASVDAYNKTVGALESRVLVTARRFRDLRVIEGDLEPPEQVERRPRVLQAPEFDRAEASFGAGEDEELLGLLEPRELRPYGLRPGGDQPRRSTVNE
jgi:DNA recombination protein RmuC